ncbi:MAG: hypothetical protein QMD36_06560 [Candidatus Aenigmarchaeota archaeon]|nr:hypothetical protein [Candidatus Aenigmarchaeota archaeon]
MGSIHFQKDGKIFKVDEDATGAEIKKMLNLPPDSVLINARNEEIKDRDRIASRVRDGETVAARPSYINW